MLKTLILGLVFTGISGVQAAIISSYDFNYSLTDTEGVGPDLEALGGTLTSDGYTFSDNNGLRLSMGLGAVDQYAIEVGFRVTGSLSGYQKIIDFKELSEDYGLYMSRGQVRFYSVSSGLASLELDKDVVVGISLLNKTISLYLDNVLLGEFDDDGTAVASTNVLNFFVDDFKTRQRETMSGTLNFLRFHDHPSSFGTEPEALTQAFSSSSVSLAATPVPLPASIWMMLSAMLGYWGLRHDWIAALRRMSSRVFAL